MNQLSAGRTLMGDSLGFHIMFALLGVGIPLLISVAELIGLVKKDNHYTLMAKQWTFGMAALFVIGAISGTIISMQLSALWPVFMAFAGKVIGLPFFMEGFAFFIEAIFLGIYAYTWDRFENKPITIFSKKIVMGKYLHWLCSLPIVLGSVASAFFITTANSFMNSPQGFTLTNGVIRNINPIKAMFNPATPTETSHSIFAYYTTTMLAFAGLYACLLFKKILDAKVKVYYQKIIVLTMTLGLIFAIGTALTGDSSAKFIARDEPIKFAAAEDLRQTGSDQDFQFAGNFGDKLEDSFGLHGLLSWLAFGSTKAVVRGLDAFDPNLWPPGFVHSMFDFMAVIGIFITIVPLLFLLFLWKKKNWAFSKIMLVAIMLCGIFGFCAVEFGWVLTEVGRQPWVIKGIMTTSQAFTTNPNVASFGYIFPCFYVVLFIVTPWILLRHYRKYPAGKEL